MPRPVFADPKTDFVFKRLFGNEAHKSLTIALLNSLLELEGSERIVDIRFLSPEQKIAIAEFKNSFLDIKCIDACGTQYVVEMQVLNVEGFEKRIVYNTSKAYVTQLRVGDHYPTLRDVVGITICDFNVWPPEKNPGVPMLSRWRMQEQHGGALGLSQVQYVFLELPKYSAGDGPETMLDKWAYFFREAENVDIVPEAMRGEPFKDAFEIATVAKFTESEWDIYDRSKIAEQDARGAYSLAIREGEARGEAKGRAEGEAKGRAEGEAKGRAEAIVTLLDVRGIAVSEAVRTRILACTESVQLARWLLGAATAINADDVFRDGEG